jgi:ATP-dependent helicase Lhr and Lhr-like helicase
MSHKLLPILHQSTTTLIFTNTRAQCEVWYKHLLERDPSLAGIIAMHHGSISKDLRHWVEDALYDGRLKAVVCTSSLDLGVDFAPVESIVQIGGPKGVARFLQRAGRSGHRPNAASKIWFFPTHSLELIEAAALREAIEIEFLESREPLIRCFDVLVQFVVTLSLGDGFDEAELFGQIQSTYCFQTITDQEWKWVMAFVTTGGLSLKAYPDFQRVSFKDGKYMVSNQRIARRHRISIGTIVSDTMMVVKFKRGGAIGHIEESFIAGLNEGDHFWFGGLGLQLIQVKELTAYVRKSETKTGKIPSWQGGTLPLTSRMSHMLRKKITEAAITDQFNDPELYCIQPIIQLQKERSHVPLQHEFLIELFTSDEGHHVLFYPFEGRLVHEGLASLFAWRMGQLTPISFSLAYNDYGFELLSDQPIPIQDALEQGLLEVDNLQQHLFAGINSAELASRKFRDIGSIAGLIFKGYPGQPIRDRHLQSSAQLIFQVLQEYEPDHLLLKQAYEEVLEYQLEVRRLREALVRINQQNVILSRPSKFTPFAFPIIVDRLRTRITSETLEQRIAKMELAAD